MRTVLKLSVFFLIFILVPAAIPQRVLAKMSLDRVVGDITRSVANNLRDAGEKKTVALWRIDNRTQASVDLNALKDKVDIALLKTQRFTVVSRPDLALILAKEGLSQSPLIDQKRTAGLGKDYQIDALAYGAIYENRIVDRANLALLLKIVDTQTGAILWGGEISLEDEEYANTAIDNAISRTVRSVSDNESFIKTAEIRKIAVWKMSDNTGGGAVDESNLSDKLAIKLSALSGFQVIDRDNLERLVKEVDLDKLGIVDFVKGIGDYYAVDGLVFGSIDKYGQSISDVNREYSATLSSKMISTKSGLLVWGEESSERRSIQDLNLIRIRSQFERESKSPSWAAFLSALPSMGGVGQFYVEDALGGILFEGLTLVGLGAVGVGAYDMFITPTNQKLLPNDVLRQGLFYGGIAWVVVSHTLSAINAYDGAQVFNKKLREKYQLTVAPAPNGVMVSYRF